MPATNNAWSHFVISNCVVRRQVRLGGQPLLGTRENTGPWYKSDLRRIESFYRVLKWDYGVLGGLTPVISSCCILCCDHAKVRT